MAEEKSENKSEEKVEEKSEEKVEEKVEEISEEISEEKSENKSEEKSENKSELSELEKAIIEQRVKIDSKMRWDFRSRIINDVHRDIWDRLPLTNTQRDELILSLYSRNSGSGE